MAVMYVHDERNNDFGFAMDIQLHSYLCHNYVYLYFHFKTFHSQFTFMKMILFLKYFINKNNSYSSNSIFITFTYITLFTGVSYNHQMDIA